MRPRRLAAAFLLMAAVLLADGRWWPLDAAVLAGVVAGPLLRRRLSRGPAPARSTCVVTGAGLALSATDLRARRPVG